MTERLRTALVQTVTLFGSLGTLFCCALPALLVSVGAGAALATVVSNVPQLVWVSEHKVPLFVFAGIMLLISGLTTWSNRRAPCPMDPTLAKSCRRVRRWSTATSALSMLIYLIGFYFAFVASHFAT